MPNVPDSFDPFSLIAAHPKLVAVLAVLAFIGYALRLIAQASETAANLMGRVGRGWRASSQRRTTRALRASARQQVIETDLLRTVKHLEATVKTMDRRSLRAQLISEHKDDYLTLDAEWHADFERTAAMNGCTDLPRHTSYNDFLRDNPIRFDSIEDDE